MKVQVSSFPPKTIYIPVLQYTIHYCYLCASVSSCLVFHPHSYSRLVDGTNEQEQWFETVRRVVEGCFSLQWRHCESIASVGFDLDRAKVYRDTSVLMFWVVVL